MLEGLERLLEVTHVGPVGRAREGARARVAAVRDGLVPDAAAERVMRQTLDVLGRCESSGRRLERLDEACVESAAAILEQAAESHVERQRVLERVLEDREEARLVQELGGLEVVQTPAKLVLRDVGDGFQQGRPARPCR